MGEMTARAMSVIKSAMRPQGFNLGMNQGEVAGCNRIRIEHGIRPVGGLAASRIPDHPVDVDPGHMNSLGVQFPRHRLRQASLRELAHGERRRLRVALHARRSASEQDRAGFARQHPFCRRLADEEGAVDDPNLAREQFKRPDGMIKLKPNGLAKVKIEAMQAEVEREMERVHGKVPGGSAVVVAMGKLGGREMTAASDLDLIVIYDFGADAAASDGPKPLPPTQYYTRYTQRLINAFTAQTSEGSLYEVDMRLRPSGQKGPVATQLSSFIAYQAQEAWTWEHQALTRARVVSGPQHLRQAVERAIRDVLVRPRDRARIAADVRDMRTRIAKEKGTQDIWELKQVRGGLVDLEFIAQHLQLVHAAAHPDVLSQNTLQAFANLKRLGLLDENAAEVLLPAAQLLGDLTQVLRLCLDGPFVPADVPDGLKALLARSGGAPDFERLASDLASRQQDVAAQFDQLVV